MIQNPATVYVWLGGVWFFFFDRFGSKFRLLGYIYIVTMLILLVNGASKAEYLSPAYGMMFAGGAVFLEGFVQRRAWKWARPVLIGLPVVAGLVVMPLVLAVLPVETYIRYTEFLGVVPMSAENKRLEKLPQFYADMFGWEEMTATVLSVIQSLPATDTVSAIYTQNYGEAGAISFLGRRHGIPPTISGHNNYYLWGPGKDTCEKGVVIAVGGNLEDHQRAFEEVRLAARVQSNYAMPYENNLPIYVCRRLKRPIEEIWPQTKEYS